MGLIRLQENETFYQQDVRFKFLTGTRSGCRQTQQDGDFYYNIKGDDQRDDGRGQAGWRRGETLGEQES